MQSHSLKETGILRILILTGLCGLLIGTAIQMDLPSFQDLADRAQIKYIEHQLDKGAFSREDLLKEGWLYYNLGQYEKARQYMEQVVSGEPNISAFYCLGLIEMKYRQYENAVAKFKIVTAKSPNHAATRIALGQAYFQLGYWGQAAREFEQAIGLEPTDESARLWLGKTWINLNQPEKARDVLNTVTHGRESVEAAALLKNLLEKERY